MIDVSDLVQFLYCPRKVYFTKVQGLRFATPKMEYGWKVHGRTGRIAGRLGGEVFERVLLESERYGLKGCVDAVVRRDEECIPVDVKFSGLKEVPYRWRMQIVAYAVLIEENFRCRVRRGMIYLAESRRWTEVEVLPEDRRRLRELVARVEELMESGKFPEAERSERCRCCEMRRFCA